MCISCHKAIVVIKRRVQCFHDCIYINIDIDILTNVIPGVRLSNIILTKLNNQTVLLMFPNLSKLFIGYLRD